MGHELDPEGRQHVEEGRLAIVAVGLGGVAGQAAALVAQLGSRLRPGEQPLADALGIGGHQVEPVAVPHPGQGRMALGGKGLVEFHVAGEAGIAGAHQGVAQVVADPGQGALADQLALAQLLAVAAHRRVGRVVRRQAHGIPAGQGGAGGAVSTLHVLAIGGVVEEVELDQLDPLELQVHQGAVDSPVVGVEVDPLAEAADQRAQPAVVIVGVARGAVAGGPVALPVDPGPVEAMRFQGALAAAAVGGVRLDLAEEAVGAVVGHVAQARGHHALAGPQ
nr:hypothetical protein [Halomonas nitroreducens]